MEIKRNAQSEFELYEKIKINYGNNKRLNTHLSDLISPRQAYWKHIDPKPLEIAEILYFISGTGIERELINLLGERHGSTRKAYGIYYSPDLRKPKITEVKSRRRYLPETGKEEIEFSGYLSQLSGYMALDRLTDGTLLVFSLNEKIDDSYKTEPVIACYDVTYTKPELKTIRKHLLYTKEILEKAIITKDFSTLPFCQDWMCGRTIKTMTKPAFCSDCLKPFSNDYLMKKHKMAPRSAHHEVAYAIYEYSFDPRCKWFNQCRGQNETTNTRNETILDGHGGSIFENETLGTVSSISVDEEQIRDDLEREEFSVGTN